MYYQHINVIRHEITPNIGCLPMASGFNKVQLNEPRLTF